MIYVPGYIKTEMIATKQNHFDGCRSFSVSIKKSVTFNIGVSVLQKAD